MLKQTILYSFIFASLINTVPAYAAKPTSVPGKIGAGLLQLVHRHSYLATFPSAPLIYCKSKRFHPDKTAWVLSLIGWILAGKVTKTTTKIIMDACNIDPIKD